MRNLFFGIISEKKRIYWELQVLSFVRSYKDGITFFRFNINWNRYKDKDSPAFQIELTFINCYNHFWIYKDNPRKEEE